MFGSWKKKSGQLRMIASKNGGRSFLSMPIDKRFRP